MILKKTTKMPNYQFLWNLMLVSDTMVKGILTPTDQTHLSRIVKILHKEWGKVETKGEKK